jgi:ketosteroid isomerase-like protein
MSEENVEVVRQAYAAYAEHGVEGVLAFVAEDMVIYSIPEWPDDAEYHGHDGFRKLNRQWLENFDQFGFDLHELRDAGDEVVVLLEMTGRIKGSGVPIRQPLGGIFGDITGGLIGSVRYYLTWRHTLEAAGLSE